MRNLRLREVSNIIHFTKYNTSSTIIDTLSSTVKDPDAGIDWGQEEKGMTEDEMVGWHHLLSRLECEPTPGDNGRTGKSSVLQSMSSQRIRHNLATEQQQL
ncbi:unnamed protein product [Rangifer tarandus platyrhynchus]|uniref:Uncharacterized protein n=1 Tax=Rangifer tarandus platyrhynchus TaxID=3082113 RepID=A0AC59ZTH3_RANTA